MITNFGLDADIRKYKSRLCVKNPFVMFNPDEELGHQFLFKGDEEYAAFFLFKPYADYPEFSIAVIDAYDDFLKLEDGKTTFNVHENCTVHQFDSENQLQKNLQLFKDDC